MIFSLFPRFRIKIRDFGSRRRAAERAFEPAEKARRCGACEEFGTPRGIRTPDLLLRRQLLYPAELLAHICPRQLPPKGKPPASLWSRSKLLPTLERVMGIEPTYPAWKAGILPLNYTRRLKHNTICRGGCQYFSKKKYTKVRHPPQQGHPW